MIILVIEDVEVLDSIKVEKGIEEEHGKNVKVDITMV